jgi:hypothetical protein
MPYDGFGVFTRSYNFVQDRINGIKIQAARVDGEFDNFATGMNEVILRSGIVAMTGDFLLGGHKVTGIAAGNAGAPAISPSSDVTSGIFYPAAGVVAVSAAGTERWRANSTGGYATGKWGWSTTTPRTAVDIADIASFRGAFEDVVVSASALTGVVNIDYKTAAVYMLTSNAAANWSFNIRGDNATTLDSIMAIGQMLTLAVEVPQGGTAYYCTTITIDGGAPASLKWANGVAPTSGHTNALDVYLIRVIKTAGATFHVRASQSLEG